MNLMTGKPDWNIQHAVLKTIVAYLNTDAHLLVGVSNVDGLGIKSDGFPNEPGSSYISTAYKTAYGLTTLHDEYTLVPVNGKEVLEIACKKAMRLFS